MVRDTILGISGLSASLYGASKLCNFCAASLAALWYCERYGTAFTLFSRKHKHVEKPSLKLSYG